MNYWIQLATEQFPPSELVDQAVEVERADFDARNVSDHFQPCWEPGHSGQAWTLLGAICHATGRVGVGTGVTAPVFRYNPAVVAQFAATVKELCPAAASSGSAPARRSTRCPAAWTGPIPASRCGAWRRRSRSSTGCSTASGSTTRAASSAPTAPTCTPAASGARRCTSPPSGPTPPAWPPASATGSGRSPIPIALPT
jgi:luciferase-like monooxygenase